MLQKLMLPDACAAQKVEMHWINHLALWQRHGCMCAHITPCPLCSLRERDIVQQSPLPLLPVIRLDKGPVHCVSDSIPTALFPHVPDWAGLTHADRLSHVAGDAPLACCLSLHLTAASWMQPDIRLWKCCECPFPQYDTRCQSSGALQSL